MEPTKTILSCSILQQDVITETVQPDTALFCLLEEILASEIEPWNWIIKYVGLSLYYSTYIFYESPPPPRWEKDVLYMQHRK